MSFEQARQVAMKAAGRVARMIARGIIETASAAGFVQVVRHDGDSDDDVELFQQAGLSTRPVSGCEAIVIKVGGESDHPIVIATTLRAARPSDLALGDASLHSLDETEADRAEVRCEMAGDVELKAPKSGAFVNVGGSSEKLLLGESFETRMDTLDTAITALGTAVGTDAAIINGIKSALNAFAGSASSLLASKGKVT